MTKLTKFEQLIRRLCSYEMLEAGLGKTVFVDGVEGYLVAYDAGLGFAFTPKDDMAEDLIKYAELNEDEIEIRN